MRLYRGDDPLTPVPEVTVEPFGDRLRVVTPEGTFTALAVRVGNEVLVSVHGRQYRLSTERPRASAAGGAASGELRAPMPGLIVDVKVTSGQAVRKGETLVVLEAMKTQQPFAAPFDGTVACVAVIAGQQVADGALLAKVDPLPSEPA
ncbi:MAG: biotin/lipoyl-containing protein [Fimbriimonadaceae bacterium]|nr:biotin/lipoyl-containing protein [Fimbriimonadaceae bacterium]